jgi:hypothetical protein
MAYLSRTNAPGNEFRAAPFQTDLHASIVFVKDVSATSAAADARARRAITGRRKRAVQDL